MATDATFKSFEKELNRLVAIFERNLPELKSADYVEAKLREDFLNPFFRALGWDMENRAGLVQAKREVEVESRTQIQGRQKRADYLFRAEGRERFVCEAKKASSPHPVFDHPLPIRWGEGRGEGPRPSSRAAPVASGGDGARDIAHAARHRGIRLRGSVTFPR